MIAYQVNAFTHQGKGGNAAGVVLNPDNLNDSQMQAIAHHLGFSETAFVSRAKKSEVNNFDFSVRFFTPVMEVEFCGHATLACFALMHQKAILDAGCYIQSTKAGTLTVEITNSGAIIQQQVLPQYKSIVAVEDIASSLNLSAQDLSVDNFPIQCVTTGLVDIIVPVRHGLLDEIQPNHKAIIDVSKKNQALGYHLFEIDQVDAICQANCRNFAPLVDIPEESATGSACGALASYLHKYHPTHPTNFHFFQGRKMERMSLIKVNLELKQQQIDKVYVIGEGNLVKEMSLHLSSLN